MYNLQESRDLNQSDTVKLMSSREPENIVLGYHGTSVIAADRILEDGFRISKNAYDWLGDGVYFFQDAPKRAWEWASEHHGINAAVIRAEIVMTNCMDLMDPEWAQLLADAYDSYLMNIKALGQEIPTQSDGAHRLDREVINYTAGVLGKEGIEISCVRAVFGEGRPIYPDSALYSLSHIQIAVRDIDACIRELRREDAV